MADGPSIRPDWSLIEEPCIEGVTVNEIRPVAASTGYLTEIFRAEWFPKNATVDQVFQRTLYPGAITGWHAHAETLDRLFCVAGSVRISLFDGRRSSPTYRKVWQKICGAVRPSVVVIPPGVWHGVETIGPDMAVLINLVDKGYDYEAPDHWRLPPDTDLIPLKLGTARSSG